jgi:cell division initiation protein
MLNMNDDLTDGLIIKERRENPVGDRPRRDTASPAAERRETVSAEGETRRLSADRNLTVTPLDMRQTKFATTMRGFSRAEVNAFLLEAADGYEQALRENDRLRQEIARLEASLVQYREMESGLKSTLLSAQKLADDMREHASQEAARIVKDAEARAELTVQRAQARVEDAQREIDGLKLKRREAEVSVGAMINALQSTLEFVREQDAREQRIVQHPSVQAMAGPLPLREVAR